VSDSPKISEIDGLPALIVLNGGWRPEYAHTMEREGLTALSIRVPDDRIDFLRALPDLRGLTLSAWEARDLQPLEGLTNLEVLTLNLPKRPRLSLDFNAFPSLRSLAVYWNPGFESLFSCGGLERLWMFGPPDGDLERFADLQSLRRLEVSEGRRLTATRGVERLHSLTFLGLYLQTGLRDLAGLGDAGGLRELQIESCKKLAAIEGVSGLAKVVHLKLANCGEIESITPLAGLLELETFAAWETTNVIDGDLQVLMQLPRLRSVAMKSRRHYKPSVEEIKAVLLARAG
jgi:internalin A